MAARTILSAATVTVMALGALPACGGANEAGASPASPNAITPPPSEPAAPPLASTPPPGASAPPTPRPPPEPVDQVKVTELVAPPSGGLIAGAVEDADKVIAALQPKLQACYTNALQKDPKLAGSVTLETEIKEDGTVANVTPTSSVGLGTVVLKCLTDTMKTAKFSPPKAHTLTKLEVPLKFAPK